jgi:hypothetical protein
MIKPTKIQAAWAAGFIDGEGCFGIYPLRNSQMAHGTKHEVSIRVGQTTVEPLEILSDLFGGAIHERRNSEPNRKKLFQWKVVGPVKMAVVVETVLPYLVVKKRQAVVIRAFCDLPSENPITDSLFAKRQRLSDEIRVLNKRGS